MMKMSFKKWKIEHFLLYQNFKRLKSCSNCASLEENTYSTWCAKTGINVRSEAGFDPLYICVYSKEKNLNQLYYKKTWIRFLKPF